MSAFKRSSDKKHKRLLQDSVMSSTDSSFSHDENLRPEEGGVPRLESLKPQQLLHTPSPSKLSKRSMTLTALETQPLQILENVGVIEVVRTSFISAKILSL